MKLGIPQIVMLAYVFIELGMYLSRHGEKVYLEYNFWYCLLHYAIGLFVLYKGGFF